MPTLETDFVTKPFPFLVPSQQEDARRLVMYIAYSTTLWLIPLMFIPAWPSWKPDTTSLGTETFYGELMSLAKQNILRSSCIVPHILARFQSHWNFFTDLCRSPQHQISTQICPVGAMVIQAIKWADRQMDIGMDGLTAWYHISQRHHFHDDLMMPATLKHTLVFRWGAQY
jgi:hypothetical protein